MKILAFIIGFVGTIALLVLLASVPVWLLWNWLMPSIFGLTTISWSQALGLTVLCSVLFKTSQGLSNNES